MENWNAERQGVIDDTLRTLREQQDDKQDLVHKGMLDFDPRAFGTTKMCIQGPIKFESTFERRPVVVFGQVSPDAENTSGTTAGAFVNSIPFLVIPFVASWSWSNGRVDGFSMGLYTATDIPEGLSKHTISWVAHGTGTLYKQERIEESWSQGYDNNSTDFLQEDAFDNGDY